MIEKKIMKEIVKEFQIEEFISESLKNVGFSSSKVHKTPLGEKIIIYASRPGLIVGKKGENIQKLTQSLKSKFQLENPQIELVEIENPALDPKIVAERIASSLEKYGISKFKGIGHKMMSDVMNAGAKGIEILMSGKIPSARAKRWRFYQGYLKKSGDIAVTKIKKAYAAAQLKTGTIGIQVRIMPPDLELPDTVKPKTTQNVEKQKVEKKDNDTTSNNNNENIQEKEQQNLDIETKEENKKKPKKRANKQENTETKKEE